MEKLIALFKEYADLISFDDLAEIFKSVALLKKTTGWGQVEIDFKNGILKETKIVITQKRNNVEEKKS